jgi:beta-lactamase class A
MVSSALKRKMMVPCEPQGENLITVSDIMLLLEKLLKGEVLSSIHTSEVINILKRQQYNEKIPLYLPEGVEIAHKTGELQGVRHDVAIIYLPDNIHLLSILTKDLKDEIQGDRFIAEISKLIYDNYSIFL